MSLFIAIMACLVLAAQCQTEPERPPAPPPPPLLDGGTQCERACKRLEQLHGLDKSCPAPTEEGSDGAFGTADDIPCVEWLCVADFLDHEKLAESMSCREWNE